MSMDPAKKTPTPTPTPSPPKAASPAPSPTPTPSATKPAATQAPPAKPVAGTSKPEPSNAPPEASAKTPTETTAPRGEVVSRETAEAVKNNANVSIQRTPPNNAAEKLVSSGNLPVPGKPGTPGTEKTEPRPTAKPVGTTVATLSTNAAPGSIPEQKPTEAAGGKSEKSSTSSVSGNTGTTGSQSTGDVQPETATKANEYGIDASNRTEAEVQAEISRIEQARKLGLPETTSKTYMDAVEQGDKTAVSRHLLRATEVDSREESQSLSMADQSLKANGINDKVIPGPEASIAEQSAFRMGLKNWQGMTSEALQSEVARQQGVSAETLAKDPNAGSRQANMDRAFKYLESQGVQLQGNTYDDMVKGYAQLYKMDPKTATWADVYEKWRVSDNGGLAQVKAGNLPASIEDRAWETLKSAKGANYVAPTGVQLPQRVLDFMGPPAKPSEINGASGPYRNFGQNAAYNFQQQSFNEPAKAVEMPIRFIPADVMAAKDHPKMLNDAFGYAVQDIRLLDGNGDGVIEHKELKDVYSVGIGQGPHLDQAVNNYFTALDANKDGKIDGAENATYVMFQDDSSWLVDRELKSLQASGKLTPEQLKMVQDTINPAIQKVASSADGLITANERNFSMAFMQAMPDVVGNFMRETIDEHKMRDQFAAFEKTLDRSQLSVPTVQEAPKTVPQAPAGTLGSLIPVDPKTPKVVVVDTFSGNEKIDLDGDGTKDVFHGAAVEKFVTGGGVLPESSVVRMDVAQHKFTGAFFDEIAEKAASRQANIMAVNVSQATSIMDAKGVSRWTSFEELSKVTGIPVTPETYLDPAVRNQVRQRLFDLADRTATVPVAEDLKAVQEEYAVYGNVIRSMEKVTAQNIPIYISAGNNAVLPNGEHQVNLITLTRSAFTIGGTYADGNKVPIFVQAGVPAGNFERGVFPVQNLPNGTVDVTGDFIGDFPASVLSSPAKTIPDGQFIAGTSFAAPMRLFQDLLKRMTGQ